MKKLTALTVTLLMLGMANSYCQESGKLEGVWKIIYSKVERPDTITERTAFENPSYKIFTKKHFSLSGLLEDTEFYGHLGKYSYDGKTYTEHIKYSFGKSMMGQSIKFKSSMEGDKWTIEREGEYEGEKLKMKETWQRVE